MKVHRINTLNELDATARSELCKFFTAYHCFYYHVIFLSDRFRDIILDDLKSPIRAYSINYHMKVFKSDEFNSCKHYGRSEDNYSWFGIVELCVEFKMLYSLSQLKAAAELMAGLLIECLPRPFSQQIGVSPHSSFGKKADGLQLAVQGHPDPSAAEKIAVLTGDIYVSLLNALSDIETRNKSFGYDDLFYDDNISLKGFRLHTDSRGGITPFLREIATDLGINCSYGNLPSLDVFVYDDGYVVFQERHKHGEGLHHTEAISYEGFDPTHKRIVSVKELTECATLKVLNPKPFLMKQVSHDSKVHDIFGGKIGPRHIDFGQSVPAQALLSDAFRREIMGSLDVTENAPSSSLIALPPYSYFGDLAHEIVDRNEPCAVLSIKSRHDRFVYRDREDFINRMGASVIELNGDFYLRPITLYSAACPIVVGEGKSRVHLDAGDYCHYSRGFSQEHAPSLQTIGKAELDHKIARGELVPFENPEEASRRLAVRRQAIPQP